MRLSGLDVAFLCLEQPARPMHLGALLTFEAPHAVAPERIARLLARRAAMTPALTKSVRTTWWPPGGAEWVPAERFATGDHVFTHRLSDPGSPEQLSPLIAALMAPPLPSGLPPWQLHVISGFGQRRNRFAVLAKLHHALTDGAGIPLIAGPLLDGVTPLPQPKPATPPTGSPLGRLWDWSRHTLDDIPQRIRDLAGEATTQLRHGGRAAGIASAALAAARPRWPVYPSAAGTGGPRRDWAQVSLDSDALRQVRGRHGGTLNDVALSVIAGGLRDWLSVIGDTAVLADERPLRAFLPVDVRSRNRTRTELGNHLSGYLCDLPVAHADPLDRLRAIRDATERNKAAGPATGPGAFPLAAQAVPALAHRFLTPLLAPAAPLLFDVMITTASTPDVPLQLGGAPLRDVQPIAPLAPGQALSIALTTYQDTVHIGILSDADLAPNVDKLADATTDAAGALHHRSRA